jgi:hypothetical protein
MRKEDDLVLAGSAKHTEPHCSFVDPCSTHGIYDAFSFYLGTYRLGRAGSCTAPDCDFVTP